MRLKKRYIIPAGIVLLLVIVRLALPYFIKDYVNKTLDEMPGYTGHINDVDLHLYKGAYSIEDLIIEKINEEEQVPFLEINSIDLALEWSALFKGAISGEVILMRPQLNFVAGQDTTAREPTQEAEHWTETVRKLMPLTINRFQIVDGRINYLDLNTQPRVDIFLDSLQVLALNLSNVEKKGEELPSSASIFARTIGGGILKGEMEMNALKEIPDFDLDIELTHVDMTELNDFFKAYGKFDVEKGEFSVFSELILANGHLDGYIKPFFDDLVILNWEKDKEQDGFFRAAWEALVGLVKDGVKNHPRDQLATQVPISGHVNQTDTDVWKTITNTLKHAFVEAFNKGIEGSLEHQD
jgi:hypothetical protein